MDIASNPGPHKNTRTEGCAPAWVSEFTTKAATLQGGVSIIFA